MFCILLDFWHNTFPATIKSNVKIILGYTRHNWKTPVETNAQNKIIKSNFELWNTKIKYGESFFTYTIN